MTATSCYTAGKARRQVVHAQARHAGTVAMLCTQFYPPKDSVHTELQYLQGETRYLPGEIKYVNCDSGSNKQNRRVAVPCPPTTYRVDTIRDKSSVYLVNRAKEQVLENRIKELNDHNTELHTAGKLMMYWAIAATLAALLLLTLLIKQK
jgi:hypothetical protein